MCLDHPPQAGPPMGRRAALGVLGAAVVAGLSGCAGPGASGSPGIDPGPATPGTPAPSPGPAGGGASPSPAGTKRIRTSYIPDYQIPPIQNGLAPVITRIGLGIQTPTVERPHVPA
jgi:hypothetical protein